MGLLDGVSGKLCHSNPSVVEQISYKLDMGFNCMSRAVLCMESDRSSAPIKVVQPLQNAKNRQKYIFQIFA